MIHESKVFIQETPLKVSSATSGHFLSPPCVNWTETRWTASWSVEAGASKYSHFRCLTLADDSCSQLPASLWHLASDYAGTAPSPSTLCVFNPTQRDTGHFTGIGSAYRPDPTIGSGLTPDNKGTRFLCLALANRSPRNLEARCDSKWSRLTHGVTDLDSSISKKGWGIYFI